MSISPDHENNFLIQVWCREDVKDNTFYNDDNVLHSKAKERINLQINFPGICVLFFEEVLDVVTDDQRERQNRSKLIYVR